MGEMNIEIEVFIGFVAGFSVLLTLCYMIKTDARSKRRRIYERIEKLEAAFEAYKQGKTHELITYLVDKISDA